MAEEVVGTGANVEDSADLETDVDIADTDTDDDIDEELDPINEDTPIPTAAKPKTVAPPVPDQNAVFADMRRKIESESRLKATQEAQKTAQAEIDKVFSDMGLNDPYTSKPIKTKAEYDAYKQRHETEKIGSELAKAGISREALDAMIASNPAIKQAESAAKAYEEAKRHEQDLAAKTHFDNQLKAITAIDPSIKTVDDLLAHPKNEAIKGYVKKGLTILEAYKLANIDTLTSKQSQAAAQSVLNKSASKDHLTSTTVRGVGEVPISKKQMEMYRLTTNLTDDQIRKDFAKHQMKYMRGK